MADATLRREDLARGDRVAVVFDAVRHPHARRRLARVKNLVRGAATVVFEDNGELQTVTFANLELVPKERKREAPTPRATLADVPVQVVQTVPKAKAEPIAAPANTASADSVDEGLDTWLALGSELVDGMQRKIADLDEQLRSLHERAAVDRDIDATAAALGTARKRLNTLTEVARGMREGS